MCVCMYVCVCMCICVCVREGHERRGHITVNEVLEAHTAQHMHRGT
jgi:hypothetical protein